MKKMISVFALVTVLITSFSTEAFAGNVVDKQQNQSTLPKVRYYYTNSQNDVTMTGSMHWSNIEIKKYSCGSRNNIILQIEQYAARITSDDEWGAFTWVFD